MKTAHRIVSFLLSVIMVITFALPASAEDILPVQEIYSVSEQDGGDPAGDSSG